MLKAFKRSNSRSRLRAERGLASLCLVLFASSCVPGGTASRPMNLTAVMLDGAAAPLPQTPPPAPVPLELQAVAPETAVALNAAIPVVEGYNPPAPAFSLRTRSMIDRMRSIDCLTSAIYYEAASESDDGQRAVAQVVLNRVRHPTYPNSVCGVVYQGSERTTGCQFSFTCDGSLLRTPSIAGWARARRIAAAALAGSVYAPVGLATHYHTYRVLPYWASSLVKSAVIGAHIFYRWNGGWGTPAAFRQRYAGMEPLPGPKPREGALPGVPSATLLQAEIAGLIQASRQADAHRLAVAATPIDPPGTKLPKVSYTQAGLPESQVLDAYRYSGMPRDELPASVAAAGK